VQNDYTRLPPSDFSILKYSTVAAIMAPEDRAVREQQVAIATEGKNTTVKRTVKEADSLT